MNNIFHMKQINLHHLHMYVHHVMGCSKYHNWNICKFFMLLMHEMVVHQPLRLTLKYPGPICETAVKS
jgi:hypothetical protein